MRSRYLASGTGCTAASGNHLHACDCDNTVLPAQPSAVAWAHVTWLPCQQHTLLSHSALPHLVSTASSSGRLRVYAERRCCLLAAVISSAPSFAPAGQAHQQRGCTVLVVHLYMLLTQVGERGACTPPHDSPAMSGCPLPVAVGCKC